MWCAWDGVRPQMRQGWLATNLRCSLERWRLGSPIGRALLSMPFWPTVRSTLRFAAFSSACLGPFDGWVHQRRSAALQMVHQVLCEIRFRLSHLLQCIVEGANGHDVLLPNTK